MRKLDINEKKSRIKNKHGHNLSFEKTDFASSIRSYKKTTFICLKHRYEFQNTLKNILRVNVPCRYCRDEEKINKCLDAHGDKFDYSKTNSTFSEAKLNTIVCKKHGQFKINLKDHIRYSSGGCKDCYRDNSSKRQRMDIAKYIIKANKIHNNKYDYSYLHQFKNQHELIKIICPIHGEFLKEAANHVHKILKQGCPICGYEMGNAKLRMTHDEFHDRALYTHGNFYNYSEVKELDEGIKTKISIICPLPGHGENGRFIQRVSDHLSGNGCPECGKIKGADANRVSTGDFIRRSREIHGNKFDYSKTFWKGSYINVEIICPDCGPFLIRPHNHWIRDCPKCSQKMRIKQNLWLDSLDLPNDAEHREVKITLHAEWFRVDGYNKKTNTIYEFNGDFWHGNPKKYSSNIINPVSGVTYGDLYKNTCLREIKLKNNGYQVISIWESDWDKTS